MLLVLNTGSSSIKLAIFEADLTLRLFGSITGIGGGDHRADLTLGGKTREICAETYRDAIAALLDALPAAGFEAGTLSLAAHRVVHGGDRLTAPTWLTEEVVATIREMVPLAPLHNPPALAGIDALSALRPGLPQIASFDTAFHSGQSDLATAYALPKALHAKGLRRYGFHGLSYAGSSTGLAPIFQSGFWRCISVRGSAWRQFDTAKAWR